MSANPEAAKVTEYGLFDLLRFLLASVVALSHIGLIGWSNAGNLAVQVFFALSGWLIGTILYRTKPAHLCRFYFNRATRIWIPYLVCVVMLYTVSALHEPRSGRWLEFLGYDLTFTHNWFSLLPDPAIALGQMPLHGTGNHFWSLAVEEQFYLIAPLIITLFAFGRSIILWALIGAVACATASQYGAISLSVLAVMIAGRYPNWYRSPVIAVAAVGSAAILWRFYAYAAPVFAVSAVLLCAIPLRRGGLVRWLGGVSFPFYLNAWIGVFAFNAVAKHFGLHESTLLMLVEFLCALGAGIVSYHLIDVQVMSRRDRFYHPRIGWAVGVAGYTLIGAGIALWVASH